jgi:hypothetical protein
LLKELECPGQAAMLKDLSDPCQDKNIGVGHSQIKGNPLDIEEFDMGYVSFQQLESI